MIGTKRGSFSITNLLTFDFPFFLAMAKPKLTQSQRRKLQKAKAAAAALTGPPAPTTGPRDGAVHRVVLPAARGRQSGLRKQVEMIVKHYHFYLQVVAGGSVIPPGGQGMSVPPPATILCAESPEGRAKSPQSFDTKDRSQLEQTRSEK